MSTYHHFALTIYEAVNTFCSFPMKVFVVEIGISEPDLRLLISFVCVKGPSLF